MFLVLHINLFFSSMHVYDLYLYLIILQHFKSWNVSCRSFLCDYKSPSGDSYLYYKLPNDCRTSWSCSDTCQSVKRNKIILRFSVQLDDRPGNGMACILAHASAWLHIHTNTLSGNVFFMCILYMRSLF